MSDEFSPSTISEAPDASRRSDRERLSRAAGAGNSSRCFRTRDRVEGDRHERFSMTIGLIRAAAFPASIVVGSSRQH
jgi:hypothetical protein